MPFHIRLQNRTEPRIRQKLPSTTWYKTPSTSLILEFGQGVAFGLGIATLMLIVAWLVQTNGLAI